MVNVPKIRGRMVELGLTVRAVADALSLDPASVYRRLNHPEQITVGEANILKGLLQLSGEEASAIFFAT